MYGKQQPLWTDSKLSFNIYHWLRINKYPNKLLLLKLSVSHTGGDIIHFHRAIKLVPLILKWKSSWKAQPVSKRILANQSQKILKGDTALHRQMVTRN